MTFRVAVGRLAEEDEPTKAAAKDAPKSKGKGKEPDKTAASGGPNRAASPDRARPRAADRRAAHQVRLGKDPKGVIVLEVDPASPAAEKGIKAGDVIVEVAQEAVTSVDDITKGIDKVKKAGRKAVLLRLEGGKGDMRFVAVPVR